MTVADSRLHPQAARLAETIGRLSHRHQSDLGVERALQQWDDFFTAAALRVGQPQETR